MQADFLGKTPLHAEAGPSFPSRTTSPRSSSSFVVLPTVGPPSVDAHGRLPERQRQEPCNEQEPMKQKTEIRGRKIAYCLLGPEDAPVIVLSHALGSSSEIWGYQLPVLSAKFRVLVYDLPGHGESDPPVGQDSFDDLATDLAALLDHTGVGRVTFAGLSIGGMIAQHFALLYPNRLQALILCSTGAQTNEAAQKIWAERIARVNEGGVETMVEGSIGRWFTPQFLSSAPATVEWVRSIYRKTSVAGFINAVPSHPAARHGRSTFEYCRANFAGSGGTGSSLSGKRFESNPVPDQKRPIKAPDRSSSYR